MVSLFITREGFGGVNFFSLPFIVFMVIVLISLGIFFLLNYRLFLLLEREDWPALAYYLEQKILIKGKYSVKKVRLLASSYLVISDYSSVLKLENKALLVKPAVVDKNVLIFGAAKILAGNYVDAAAFFKQHLEKNRLKKYDAQWVRWFYGFSNLLGGAFSQVEQEFMSLAVSSRDALITGLSSYFLYNNLAKQSEKKQECLSIADNGKNRVINALKNEDGWKKEIEKTATEIHIAIVRKYIDEAGQWLFASA
jgi:hypothetical protein